MLLFWPQKSHFQYFHEYDAPLNFLIVFLATLLAISFLNLRGGKGDFIIQEFAEKMTRAEKETEDEKRGFLSFGLPRAALQTLFLCLPFSPILIISATLSEVSLPMLSQAVIILYSSALLCRLFGFLVYLFFGKWNPTGTFICWLFFFAYFVGTGFYTVFANPILLIYHYFRGTGGFSDFENQSQINYLLFLCIAISILTILCWFKIRRGRVRGAA